MENKKTTEELFKEMIAADAAIAEELRESFGDLVDMLEDEEENELDYL